MKALDIFQLVAGDFQNNGRIGAGFQCNARERLTDVACDESGAASGLKQFTDESCRRRLAVGSGDGDKLFVGGMPAGQLQLTPDWNAGFPDFIEDGKMPGDAGTANDEIRIEQ